MKVSLLLLRPGTPMFDLGEHFNTKHATNLGGQTPGSLTAGAGFRPGALECAQRPRQPTPA